MGAGGKTANSTPIDGAALTPVLAWSVGGIRATAEDEADFFRGLFSVKLLPRAQVAMMEDTSAISGAYGLGFHADRRLRPRLRSYTKAINTTCARAWGHGGAFPGYYQLPISSPSATANCRGVTS
jgi:D-alanyl-D-alanine carboxypeptidase